MTDREQIPDRKIVYTDEDTELTLTFRALDRGEKIFMDLSVVGEMVKIELPFIEFEPNEDDPESLSEGYQIIIAELAYRLSGVKEKLDGIKSIVERE